MVNTTAKICLVIFSALLLAAAACGTGPRNAERMVAVQYPEPRYPSYLKPPSTIDEVLPHVRPLARNTFGFQGNGLGIAQSGETVAFILAPTAEDMIVQAVKKAMVERGVTVNLVPEYEVAGVSKADAAAFGKARRTFTSEQGYMEATWWVESKQIMEPLVHVDKLTVKDPEGTDVWADITEDMAQRWARGVYQRGHFYMFPNQASLRFGYSVVNYPAFQDEWLARGPMALLNGTIAGTTNHTGDYAPDPWRTVKDVIDRVLAGKYEHFFPTTEH